MSKFLFYILFSVTITGIILTSLAVQASACCGGGFALPSLITGDDQAQLTTSFSYSKVDTTVFPTGIWQKVKQNDILRTFRIEYASIVLDRYQMGFAVPLQSRSFTSVTENSSTGLGDITGQIGYEYLTDWEYNKWQPKGIGYFLLTLPTGKSVYDSDIGGLDSLSRGFYVIGLGTTLLKAWTYWDTHSTFEVHHSFDREFNHNQATDIVNPGYGGSFSVGAGYNIKDFRFGTSVNWNYEDPINVIGPNQSIGSVQRYATGSLSASYLFQDNWGGTFSYNDQTLLGEPTNSSLNKSIQISLQKRWAR